MLLSIPETVILLAHLAQKCLFEIMSHLVGSVGVLGRKSASVMSGVEPCISRVTQSVLARLNRFRAPL